MVLHTDACQAIHDVFCRHLTNNVGKRMSAPRQERSFDDLVSKEDRPGIDASLEVS